MNKTWQSFLQCIFGDIVVMHRMTLEQETGLMSLILEVLGVLRTEPMTVYYW